MAGESAMKLKNVATPVGNAEWVLNELIIARRSKKFGLRVETLADQFACDAAGWELWPNLYQLLIGMREERFTPKQIQKVLDFFGYEGVDWEDDKKGQGRLF